MGDCDQHDQRLIHGCEDHEEETFEFVILDTTPNVFLKNIPPSVLPNFHGMNTTNRNTFLF